MKPRISFLFLFLIAGALILLSFPARLRPHPHGQQVQRAHLGFDLNIFPGKDALPIFRKTFAFSGYWLSPPPGEKKNTWIGQRESVRSRGFGFLLLYRGRESRELKNPTTAIEKGTLDARNAAATAKSEGFPAQAIIFVDIEEGGRLPETYHAYLKSWAKRMEETGYRSGAYCSGMPVVEEGGVTITTADDIRAHMASQKLVFFVYNDACPPSPGCIFRQAPDLPASSGIPYAALWQYAQSPRRKEFTAHCAPGYNADGNCYAPGDARHAWLLDVDSATSSDPSNGR